MRVAGRGDCNVWGLQGLGVTECEGLACGGCGLRGLPNVRVGVAEYRICNV